MGKLDVIVILGILLTVSASVLYSRNLRSGILLKMCSPQSRNQIWCSSNTQTQYSYSCMAYVGVLVHKRRIKNAVIWMTYHNEIELMPSQRHFTIVLMSPFTSYDKK
jgi:predicted membrane-bound mannosyltransferase